MSRIISFPSFTVTLILLLDCFNNMYAKHIYIFYVYRLVKIYVRYKYFYILQVILIAFRVSKNNTFKEFSVPKRIQFKAMFL